jgi:hypothetical protein
MTSLPTGEVTETYWQRMHRLCGCEKKEREKRNERMNDLLFNNGRKNGKKKKKRLE